MNKRYKPIGKIIIIVFLLILILLSIWFRIQSQQTLAATTEALTIPSVAVIITKQGPATEEIVLPGNVQAWHEAIIYARTNGYIKKWYVDIGSHVEEGELLAEIDSPEIDAQLAKAEADLNTAIANANLAQSTAKRWINLLKTDSVSKQETDEKISTAKALQATAEAAKANRDSLLELVKFEKVTAPFAGVITSRTTDVGLLISAGSGATAVPLFRLVQSNPLRVYVRVPENYAGSMSKDMQVKVYFAEFPGKPFTAKLLLTAGAIDPGTRSLLTQFILQNDDGKLLPGSFTQVHITVPVPSQLIRLPVNTLLFRKEGLEVATVNDDNRVVLKAVKVNRDYGNEVEINSGLSVGEKVILNPSDSLLNGQPVHVVETK